jgi:uncharacterized protein with GYD domain
MALYVSLVNWTQEGVKKVKESPKRAEAFKAAAKKAGCEVKQVLWTMGRYDIVAITEASDDAAMSRLALGVAMLGNVRTETLRAYTGSEFEEIVKGIK